MKQSGMLLMRRRQRRFDAVHESVIASDLVIRSLRVHARVQSDQGRYWHLATFRWAAELGRYQSRADMAPTFCQLNSVANDPTRNCG